MRIRLPFAGVFLLLLLLAGYAGLSSLQLGAYINDKALHFLTFFLLTVVFYWIVDTSRRRTLHMTLVVCTLVLGVGSEFVQSFLPNDRDFDLYDIVANIIGSLLGLGLCAWYHKRMLERKRQRKHYDAVPGEDTEDVELGQGQESGITDGPARGRTLEEEVDNWDENAEDNWDDDNLSIPDTVSPAVAKETGAPDAREAKKRTD
ncbi:hypothetical protein BBK36DRAFT_1167076 [Trichoderma citrinoviride]|uniref:VanZ-like domain-containing protein n=1 Tax=Trichoderma citrinoviride TaxID=58853 RepID=A0A2T4BIV3_9HYPO|nr:hypothetical protein BBK36DRAFT_1167076 [Trichoderma citrinoviride]PTB69218.1 hypothetical protein BBK36DRAFT_1167076 [Trichoderma citrinoviride]